MIVELGTSASARHMMVLHNEHFGTPKMLGCLAGTTQERHRMGNGVEHPCLEVKLEAGRQTLAWALNYVYYHELRGGAFVE